MHAITWNRSFKGIQGGETVKDNFDSEEYETHATVLDKLLAWEKKLYEEVKVHFDKFLDSHVEMCSVLVGLYDSVKTS